jgi:hypothetical protein
MKEDEDNLYPQYCRHGQAIYNPFCSGCIDERRQKQQYYYDKYWNKRRPFNFHKYFNDTYEYYFTDPSSLSPRKLEIRKDDKFIKLKKSNSQEELKKNYYKLAKKFHPDKEGGDTKLFQKLSQLYDLLKLSIPI